MAISTKYNPKEVEDKWYQYWLDHKFFRSQPNPKKEPYCIIIPPPNVTGVLHMGHMLNNTIQDVLVRKARMEGKEALWVPGTDHASIATEAKVVKMLKERGINKRDLSREEFLEHAWEWKEKYGGIILEQLKKLGASCDWDRTYFTLSDKLSRSVLKVFVDLYNKGYIYKGYRMVNWDPEGRTALSDDEVIHKEVNSYLYYIRYKIEGEDEFLTIATTRPETILGDTAICINPKDQRYHHLKGKKALVPLIDRPIPIIEDDYVDMEFGTGCLKVTPAHDTHDYELGQKHNLESIDIFNDDGSLNQNAQLYIGEDRFEVREKIAFELKEKEYLIKTEEYLNNVGFSERTDAVVEPKLSRQWFVKMDQITKPALKNVLNDNVKLHPAKFKNMYRHWMENVRDWCISRQLWWGHRIPAYYLPDGQFVVAEDAETALQLAKEKSGNSALTLADLKQDEDVLDTWFSAGIIPLSVFDGIEHPDNPDINYYYPTNDLVTAPEILFFWVARMIIFGYEYQNEKPFKNVYLTGIVRDKQSRKMSKSLGNSPEPLDLIKQYSADGVRTGMLFSSPAGNDLLFDIKLCEQGRNFANKIWNVLRLMKGWEVDQDESRNPNEKVIYWFNSRFNQALKEIEDHFAKYRVSDALMATYKVIWDDFCSWYLELIKPEYGKPIDLKTYQASISFLEDLMKILHPFMPFITEEIWHQIKERKDKESIMMAQWPTAGEVDDIILKEANITFGIISNIRGIRNSQKISSKQPLPLMIKTSNENFYQDFEPYLIKLGNLKRIGFTQDKISSSSRFVIERDEFFLLLGDSLDKDKEREEIQKELDYTTGFLQSIKKKLTNRKFVQNAPGKVVEKERKKQADAEAKIKVLEESLSHLQ